MPNADNQTNEEKKMPSIEGFKGMIDIDEKGHYPHMMWAVNHQNTLDVYSLDLSHSPNPVLSNYVAWVRAYKKNPKAIYLTLDFPAIPALGMELDFVAVHKWIKGEAFEMVLIPYSGQIKLPEVKEGSAVENLTKQFFHIINKLCNSNALVSPFDAAKMN